MSLINDALKRARQTQKRPAISPSGEAALAAPPSLQPVEETGRGKPQRLLVVIPVLLLSLGVSLWFFAKWRNAEKKAAGLSTPAKSVVAKTDASAQGNPLTRAIATAAKWEERQQAQPSNSPSAGSAQAQPNSVGPSAQQPQTSVAGAHSSPVAPTTSASTKTLPAPASAPDAGAPLVAANWIGTATTSPTTTAAVNVNASTAIPSPITTAPPPPVSASKTPEPLPSTPVVTTPLSDLKLQGIFYRLRRPTALIDGRIVSPGDLISGYRVTRIDRDSVKLMAGGRTNTLTLY